jgi:tetratricopeptide (TPR) repeat protein
MCWRRSRNWKRTAIATTACAGWPTSSRASTNPRRRDNHLDGRWRPTYHRRGFVRDKGLASIYCARASWKEKKRDLDAALQEYDRATKIDPTYAAAYYSRGQVYEKKGDLDKARARLKALAEGGAKQEPVK